jgi:hypothetical protein
MAIVQLGIYIAMVVRHLGAWQWLDFLDPRLPLRLALDLLELPGGIQDAIPWLSAVWLASTGVLLVCTARYLRVYIWSEVFLGLVPALCVLPVAILFGSNLRQRHSPDEFAVPLTTLLATTILPLYWAVRLARNASATIPSGLRHK